MTILLSVSFLCAVIDDYDYVFSENGLVAHKDGKLIGTQVLFTAQKQNTKKAVTFVTDVYKFRYPQKTRARSVKMVLFNLVC